MPAMPSRRPQRLLPSLFSALLLLQAAAPAGAVPYPKDDLHDVDGMGFLMPRACANYCGYQNMYCCGAEQQCYTSEGIAGCRNTAAGGGINFYTTTWTETETFTSTYSSYFPATTTEAAANCVPVPGTGQIACGSICCANWQYCAYDGQCMANVGAVTTATAAATTTAAPVPVQTSTYTTTGGVVVVTTAYSAPVKVTSGAATGTGTAIGASASGNITIGAGATKSLSGGAIAGIVVGTLAGVVLLVAICACCLVRGLWHGLLALLGIGGAAAAARRRHSGSVEDQRVHRTWFGRRPHVTGVAGSASSVSEKPHHKGGKLLGIGAAIGTLLLLLGLRRKEREHGHDQQRPHSAAGALPPRRRPFHARSDVSSTYYSDVFSSRSSGPMSGSSRRSRNTRVSRRTDATRVSRSSRPSRQSRSRTASRI